jgi:antitoxin (DNA-binding transcriptional repressor) of toxin-antitoxin stability system
MTMIMVNIHEAKAKLSEYLEAVARGERVLICKRNQPVAELRAMPAQRTEPRPVGGGPHAFNVPKSFFEAMPDDWLADFESGPVYPDVKPKRRSRVAEHRAIYGKRGTGKGRNR